jgi:uncharacterized membrane protein YeaQ/YmgE (transglycosylase-associated protein family)
MSVLTFILTGLIVGIIAKALVAGREPATGIVLLVGTAAQIVSWLLLGAIGLGGYGQPWSFFASIGVAAVMLSLYNDALERRGMPTDIPRPPSRPFGKRALDASGLALSGALLMGVTGFLIGFFGPMKYQPWANQGPMVGIFLTGPGGLLLGGLIGTALGFMQPAWSFRRRVWTLNAANLVWGLFVLDLVADRSWWP